MSRLVTKPLSRYSAYYDPLNLPNHGLPSRTDEKLQGDRSSASLKACSTPVPSRISRWLHRSKKIHTSFRGLKMLKDAPYFPHPPLAWPPRAVAASALTPA
jgi:hypothetical protein